MYAVESCPQTIPFSLFILNFPSYKALILWELLFYSNPCINPLIFLLRSFILLISRSLLNSFTLVTLELNEQFSLHIQRVKLIHHFRYPSRIHPRLAHLMSALMCLYVTKEVVIIICFHLICYCTNRRFLPLPLFKTQFFYCRLKFKTVNITVSGINGVHGEYWSMNTIV